MSKTQYTLDELAVEVNRRAADLKLTPLDQRSRELLSTRRIRDYTSKGLVAKPERSGRNAFYGEKQVTQLLALRSLQADGLSDRYISNQIDLQDLNFVGSYVASKSMSSFDEQTNRSTLLASSPGLSPDNPALRANEFIRKGGDSGSLSLAATTKNLAGSFGLGTAHVNASATFEKPAQSLPPSPSVAPVSGRQWSLAEGRVQLTLLDGAKLSLEQQQDLRQQIDTILSTSL